MIGLLLGLLATPEAMPCGAASLHSDSTCPLTCLREDWLSPYLSPPACDTPPALLAQQLTTPGQVPPELEALIERPEPCQLCVLQRDGSKLDIIRRGIGGDSVPNEEIAFGHCFVCVQCPGSWLPTCRGWWPADPDGGDYEGDEGRLYDDMDEVWQEAACTPLSRARAATLEGYLETYQALNTYQVTNNDTARSCTGFCTDVADVAGVRWFSFMGDYTVPGDVWFEGQEERNTTDELPFELMNRRVEGWKE